MNYTDTSCCFSADRAYRYWLTREWFRLSGSEDKNPYLAFIGANPSVADQDHDDATIKRLVSISSHLGYSKMMVVNLFAYRATDFRVLKQAQYPVGFGNDAAILAVCRGAAAVLACWGNFGQFRDRGQEVVDLIAPHMDIWAFELNNSGQPHHPLYLKWSNRLLIWKITQEGGYYEAPVDAYITI